MNNEANANGESPASSADGKASARARSRARNHATRNGSPPADAAEGESQFSASDLLPFMDALGRRWKWLLTGGGAMALVGLLCGLLLWKNSYTASAQLLRQTSMRMTEVLGDRELDQNTYASLLRAPELLLRVAAQATPPLPVESLARTLNITSERNSDVLLVAVSTGDRQSAVELANLYAQEAVRFTQELQTNAAARVGLFVTQQLAPLEDEITALNQTSKPISGRRAVAVMASPLRLIEKLQSARLELAELLTRYTELHPLVPQQRAKIAVYESQLLEIPAAPAMLSEVASAATAEPLLQERDPAFINAKVQTLESARLTLLGQKQAALSLVINPPGTCRLLARATPQEAIAHKRTAKVALLAGVGGLLGLLITMSFILLAEAVDPRLKTAADVRRVTGLPVIASAHDLARMTEEEQKNWGFRAWTRLQGLLSPSPNQGFVCGFTSSENGEGRSTWIRLLADAASQRGFRVLTVVARPPEANGQATVETGPVANGTAKVEAILPVNDHGAMVVSHVLNTPAEVTQKLIGPNPEPVVQIPLPGWVWNLERRKQWHAALRHWSQIHNIALLIELPPASLPETVLLAENLPNLIWLADGEKATAVKTREQLETLRNARCHLAGAVLNRAPVPFWTNRFARWIGCAALGFGLNGLPAYCQETTTGSHTFTQGQGLRLGTLIPAGGGIQAALPESLPPP